MERATVDNRDQARGERHQQERLLAALDAAPSQLRRDEAGWWVITGRRGTIQTWGDRTSWLVYVIGRSNRHWTMIKSRLTFMAITQDGEEEGCLRLHAFPTAEQSGLIREALLLRKRRMLTEASRALLIAAGATGRFRARGTANASRPDLGTPDALHGDISAHPWLVVERERILEAEGEPA